MSPSINIDISYLSEEVSPVPIYLHRHAKKPRRDLKPVPSPPPGRGNKDFRFIKYEMCRKIARTLLPSCGEDFPLFFHSIGSVERNANNYYRLGPSSGFP